MFLPLALLLLGITHDTKVQTIRIEARWAGLGEPIAENATVRRDGDDYVIGSRRVQAARIDELVRALTAPALSQEAGLLQLTTAEWLRSHADKSYAVLSSAQKECSNAARNLFIATFTDRDDAIAALREHYGSTHTDDHPSMQVEVLTDAGRTLRASSHSQNALMLPWKIDEAETWNPAISRAVAALLPESSRLRGRLTDEDLTEALASAVGDQIREPWEELQERCLYSGITAALEQRFKIATVYHAWPGQFAGHLSRADLPKNLLIDVHISADESTADRLKVFFTQIEIYIARARKFVESHPELVFELEYFDGESLGPTSLQLHDISRPDDPNLRRVKAALRECVLLRDHNDPYANRNWVVLPTGEGIDWTQ